MIPRPILLSFVMASSVFAQDAPEGTTSNSREIQAVPAPGPVVIDGDDKDWDLSAGIWSYNNPTLVDRYSVWTHVMWDEKGVYVLMRYRDSSPMKNAASGIDFERSWQADAFQGRVVFDEKTDAEHQMHINIFYSTPDDKPFMIVQHGGFKSEEPYDETGPARADQLEKYGNTMESHGGKVAFKAWEDGKGYNMEAFWPWSYLRTNAEPLKAGDSFILGVEAMWGSDTGEALEHRLVDSLKDDTVNRIFFFRAKDGWGRVVLAPEGNLKITEQQKELQAARLKQFVDYDTVGSIPITYSVPADSDVTIAIDNAEGRRVRNLFGQYPREAGEHTDLWDGLDDSGSAVPPGKYSATVVDHPPVELKFVNSVYNSATPPWVTSKGSLTWGSNHGNPTTAATRGDVTLLGFTGTEGSTGLQRVNADGIIQWTDRTELLDVTLDDKKAYIISRESHTARVMVRSLDLETGKILLFDNPERSTETILPLEYKEVPDGSSIAYAEGKLFVFIPGKGTWKIDPATGAIEQELTIPDLVALDNHEDRLLGLLSDGRIVRLDASGKVTETVLKTSGLTKPVRFAISQDGTRFAISDQGTHQVFIFEQSGKLINTLGEARKTEDKLRPAGKFIETDLNLPLGLAFDKAGRLWVAEADYSGRRVTLWNSDGTLASQFWGAADYGAMYGFPFVHDSTRFIVHGIEFKLDPNPDIMNKPTQERPLMFHPEISGVNRGLIYELNGHEYAMTPHDGASRSFEIAKRDKDGVFKVVVKVEYDNHRTPEVNESKAWIDKNHNGKEDEGETVNGIKGANVYWTAGWVRPDLTIITADQYIYRPTGFTDSGVPLYDFNKPELPKTPVPFITKGDNNDKGPNGSMGSMVMDSAGNISDGLNYATIDGRIGSYPSPHKRHDAPAARRGLIVAPFRTNGVVEDVPGVGSITAIGGDRGEWFLLTLDGLYLSSILQDSKGDVTLDDKYVNQESFGGWIWRDEKDRILVQLGGPSFRIMEVLGLDKARKNIVNLDVTEKEIQEGVKIAAASKKAAYEEPKTLSITKLDNLPYMPPSPETGVSVPLIPGAETARVQEEGDPTRWFRVSMARNDNDLVIAWQVNDPSPWKNAEGRFSHAFIGGDSVDLQLDVPGRGPIRVLGAPVGGENTVAYWQKTADAQENPTTYVVPNNEANAQKFDIVKRLQKAQIKVDVGSGKYSVLMTIPLAELGLDSADVKELKGVVGVIFSDPAGSNRAARMYWHQKDTGMVSDVPTESSLQPDKWGTIEIKP